jgi:hypothetical protein
MNKVIIFAIYSLLLTASCAKQAQYDLHNINLYSPESEQKFQQEKHLIPPYIAFFKTHNRQLLYIAAKHQIGDKNSTFQLIKNAFDKFNPDIVLLEGIEETKDAPPNWIKKYIQQFCLPKWQCGEPLYAAHLAIIKNIKFLGAEPENSEIFKLLQSQNYNKQDVVFFYFTRQIPQYYREKLIISQNDLATLFTEFLPNFIKNHKYNFNDYQIWLKEKIDQKISLQNLIDAELTAPIASGNYLQKLSSKLGIIRDQHIAKAILENAAKHKKTLIIFGHSHYLSQKDVLEKYLGNASYFSNLENIVEY